jgi:hypothetical protein
MPPPPPNFIPCYLITLQIFGEAGAHTVQSTASEILLAVKRGVRQIKEEALYVYVTRMSNTYC